MGEAHTGGMGKYDFYVPVDPMAVSLSIVHLHSSYADSLKYVHPNALGYNKCRFNSAFEVALMMKSLNGERK